MRLAYITRILAPGNLSTYLLRMGFSTSWPAAQKEPLEAHALIQGQEAALSMGGHSNELSIRNTKVKPWISRSIL